MTHFLLTPAARSLSLAQVLRLSDEEAFDVFRRVRWAENGGEPFCPHCGVAKVYTLTETPIRWKCSGCRRKFSVTSGTLFHSRKLAVRDYLAVIALFVNGVKGTSALQISRDMNINPKSAFVLLHKLREAMGATLDGIEEIGGEGREAEVDGAYFGGHVRPENRKADRKDRRGVENPKRRVVVVARERGGQTVTWVVDRESDAVPMIRRRVASGTTVHADESAAWNVLHASYPMLRVNHSFEYRSEEGACTNQAESFFARLRRAEFGQYHKISGRLLSAYAAETAWRENNRRNDNGRNWRLAAGAALAHSKSARWCGYWHRERVAA
ncbi:MAG: IS1595 family transposase [Alphaproteobacteria bacterium]|nr:IS1595 family transposase [Alphaproteobacteria bacterium]